MDLAVYAKSSSSAFYVCFFYLSSVISTSPSVTWPCCNKHQNWYKCKKKPVNYTLYKQHDIPKQQKSQNVIFLHNRELAFRRWVAQIIEIIPFFVIFSVSDELLVVINVIIIIIIIIITFYFRQQMFTFRNIQEYNRIACIMRTQFTILQ